MQRKVLFRIHHSSLRILFAVGLAICLLFEMLFGAPTQLNNLGLGANVANAATIVVNSTADNGAGACPSANNCQLRTAIAAANPGDTITFSVSGTITLTLGDITIAKNLTITGPGANVLSVNGNSVSRIFYVASGNVIITDLTMTNGRANSDDHGSGYIGGGAIFNEAGNLTLNRVVVSNSIAIGSDPINDTVFGGGIFNNNGSVALLNSEVSGNQEANGTGCCGGGGIADFGGTGTSFSIVNSTIAYNSSDTLGGGVYATGTSMLIRNSTLAFNSAAQGGNFDSDSGVTNFRNTIISNGTAPSGPDIVAANNRVSSGTGTIATNNNDGYNLIGNTTGLLAGNPLLLDSTNQNNVNPQLSSTLTLNTPGTTRTLSIPTTSPAKDAGNPAGCVDQTNSPLTIDQRGVTRADGIISGTRCDVGAFEYQAPAAPPTIGKAFNPTLIQHGNTSTITFTLTNPNAFALNNANFTDNLPANLVVANSPTIGGTCASTTNTPALVGGATALNLTVPVLAASAACTITVPVTDVLPNPATYNNTASGVTTTQTVTAGTASNTATLTVAVPPTISKAFSPATILVNGTSTMTFTLTNPNAVALTNAHFTDTLTGMTVANATIGGTCVGTTNSPALIVGATALDLTVPNLPTTGCTIDIQVTSASLGAHPNQTSGVDTSETPTAGTVSNSAVLTVNAAAPTIAKAFSPTTMPVNSVSTITFTLSNSNGIALTNAHFTDALPANLVVANTPNLGGTCVGTTNTPALAGGATALDLTVPSLPAAGCTITVDVTSATAGTYNNTTSGVDTTETPTAGAVSNTATLTVLAPPTIAKAFSPTTIPVNGTSTITFTLTNPNGVALTNANFTDTLTGMTVSNATIGGTCVGTTNTPALVVGATALDLTVPSLPTTGCTITVDVTSATAGAYPNQTSGVTSTETPTAGAASGQVTLTVVDGPTISKAFAPTTIEIGGTSTITFTLTNPNAGALTNANFTDALPANLTVASTTIGGTCVGTTNTPALAVGATALNLTVPSLPAAGCTITVAVTSTTGGVYNNTTSGITTTEIPAASPVSNTATLTVDASPTIQKAFSPATIVVGNTTTITFTVTNPNTTTLTNVNFTDTLTGMSVSTAGVGGTCTGVTGAPAINDTNLNLTIPSLASGNCTITVDVTGNTIGNPLTNQTSGATSTETPTVGNQSNVANLVVTPLLPSIQKAFSPTTMAINDVATMTFTLGNTNTSALTNANFTDALPANLTVASTTIGGTCVGTTNTPALAVGATALNLTVPSLPAGGCTITVLVTTAQNGVYNNTTSGVTTSETASASPVSNTATLTVGGAPTLTKVFAPNPTTVNTASTLTFTITNPNTTITLNGLSFSDSLPAGLLVRNPPNASTTCTGGSVGATANGNIITLNGGPSLAPSATCTVTVDVYSANPGVYNNTSGAVSSTNGGTGNTANASLTVLAPPTIAKSFTPNAIPLNGTSVLTITIANPNSTTALTGVQLGDTFPAGLVVATPLTSNTTCTGGIVAATAGGNSVGLTGATLNASTSCTVTVTVQGTGTGTLNNTTGAVSSTNGGTGTTAAATITVSPAGSLTVAKAFAPASIAINGTSTLTVTISNPGASPVTNAQLTDTLPANVVVAGTPNAGTTCAAGTVTPAANAFTLSGATIPANGSCEFHVDVTSATAGSYTNSIPANAITVNSVATTSNLATANLVVLAPPSIAKAFTPNTIPVNGVSQMTLTITNPNPSVALTGVSATDAFPGSMIVATTPNLTNTCGGTTAGGTAGANNFGLTNGTIAAGGSCTISVNVTAGATTTNTTGTVASTNAGNGNTANAQLTVVNGLTLVMNFAPTTIPVNGTSVLTFTLTNPTANPATAMDFTDTFPANLVIATTPNVQNTCGGATTGGAAGGSTIGLSNGSLLANSTCFVSVNVTSATANIYNTSTSATATINSAPVTSNTANASLSVLSGLNIAKAFGPNNIPATGTSTLTFTLTNGNAAAVTGVAFNDTMPAGLVISPVPNVQSTCGGAVTGGGAGGNSIGLTGGTIASGGTCTLSVSVTSTGANTYVNVSGPVSSNETGVGNTATASLTAGNAVQPTPQIVVADPLITKSGDLALAVPGDTVNFTLTVTNNGTAPATGVVVTDPIPNQLHVNSASSTQGTFTVNGQTVTFTIGTVNPGQTVTMHVSTTVLKSVTAPTDLTNTAYETYNEGSQRSASFSLHLINKVLPNTGEHPDAPNLWWLIGSLLAGIAILGIGVRVAIRRRA